MPANAEAGMNVPESKWRWFGNAGHFICGHDCRFHLCTQIGGFIVSTVGQYLPDSNVREIIAETSGVVLEGRGDARRADFMRKIGYETIGLGRTFETMVFRAGPRCAAKGCGCGMPDISGSELAFSGYNDAGAATRGHMRHCREAASGRLAKKLKAEGR